MYIFISRLRLQSVHWHAQNGNVLPSRVGHLNKSLGIMFLSIVSSINNHPANHRLGRPGLLQLCLTREAWLSFALLVAFRKFYAVAWKGLAHFEQQTCKTVSIILRPYDHKSILQSILLLYKSVFSATFWRYTILNKANAREKKLGGTRGISFPRLNRSSPASGLQVADAGVTRAKCPY